MQLYDSRNQDKVDFKPSDGQTTIYVCGITPYDTTHLGHAFTYCSFDVLIRYLEWQGVRVRYVQNVTDIDDDILRKARQVGKDWKTLGNEWTVHFIQDMRSLNVRPPDWYPRATDVMSEIIEMDRRLIEQGAAYESNGNVYFDVDAFDRFGELSHIPRAEMLPIANERGNHPDDPNKRDPLDFVLWQKKANGEPAWPSPWSEGRPGWHIECSAMVNRFLGPTIDIHGGGADLLFPHHECETAQSVTATGVFPLARVWMHTAMVRNRGEKMSKSLGNLVMVSDLLKQFTPDALRLYLEGYHFRESWEYQADQVGQSAAMARRWLKAAQGERGGSNEATASVREAFVRAMDDDLNTPEAIGVLDRLVNDILEGNLPSNAKAAARATLVELAGVLGLCLGQPGVEERVMKGWGEHQKRFE